MTRCLSLWFTGPHQTAVRETAVPTPGPEQVLVQTIVSAISPGTEMLFYRGQVPKGMAVDATIEAMAGEITYPLQYGYAAVGRVIACGTGVAATWQDRLVFAFHPHESHFLAAPADLIPLPEGMEPETAALLPNMETAVSFLMDGRPLIGEQVTVLGQGVVGLLTTTLLARLPLATLVTLDRHPLRRAWSRKWGATASLDPTAPKVTDRVRTLLQGKRPYAGADLAYELSGNPQALDQAIELTGYNGRVVVGSWYGDKEAHLTLGGRFHRGHMRLISSQVSHIAPRWQGRWTKARRLGQAWAMLRQGAPADLITHRIPIPKAATAYRLLDEQPEAVMQILLTYDS